ncbi:Uncharacterised protein [Pannonibacter phragmitetus]|uniref:Uncharacterized protein n=1 Tax=Pannonibacter phragmitetus TaxID=121719 RepID=A0A379A1L5_9HYPH|nr:hypothetical protein [Pannonibacter phragmitetus]SUB03029.1 Uncharacterised protein [Pannonibacter phragmitetus]
MSSFINYNLILFSNYILFVSTFIIGTISVLEFSFRMLNINVEVSNIFSIARKFGVIFLLSIIYISGYKTYTDQKKELDDSIQELSMIRDSYQNTLDDIRSNFVKEFLSKDQIEQISIELFNNKEKIDEIAVSYYITAENSIIHSSISESIERSGIKTRHLSTFSPDDPSQTGLMIHCKDAKQRDNEGKLIKNIFDKNGIYIKETPILSKSKIQNYDGCLIYIGPKEI